jgi:hypothetical protein
MSEGLEQRLPQAAAQLLLGLLQMRAAAQQLLRLLVLLPPAQHLTAFR